MKTWITKEKHERDEIIVHKICYMHPPSALSKLFLCQQKQRIVFFFEKAEDDETILRTSHLLNDFTR